MTYLTGFHAIEERIKSGGGAGPLLVAKAGPRAREIVDLAVDRKIQVNRVGTHELDRLAPDHRGIALYTEDVGAGNEASLEGFLTGLGEQKDALVVVLDEITDPHNYGAILRSCDQFGADLVITRHRRIAKHAETVAQTSAGAVSWVPVAETPNLPRAVEQLKEADFWVYGADMTGEAVWERDLRGRVAIILGGEGTGISRLLRENCDAMVAIPSKGRIDSLNVSVAAGVLFYELTRQRAKK
ncbi:RNA methyltransferase, TrmH family, group 3 [Treponema primitia ZAS-2]|uniref:RNA methyltransferase, TrmH family, group 3 n=1 Tax=Treponema primitia (strain ATCC BAA-887 / DSM 12427 / ZAS-2) TaxID=545694 RepID=F5YN75_TREPZ|nr:23S rRNA (guanosine(2251)-2'-O)-methyltransferase RlmB [Treponema primitia]AEF85979.1 RNA methyltransferase, TrmH family, group 3 [Treponema primitia ZAS-2]